MKQFYPLLFLLTVGVPLMAQQTEQKLQVRRAANGAVFRHADIGSGTLNARMGALSLESGMLSVYAGQSVRISGSVAYPGSRHAWKKVAKGVGIAGLAYVAASQVDKSMAGKSGAVRSGRTLLPSLGLGLALSARDLAGIRKRPDAYLQYFLYDKNRNLTGRRRQSLGRSAKNKFSEVGLTVDVPADGFVKVVYVNKSRRDVWVNHLSVSINDRPLSESRMAGSIAATMNLQSNGICLPEYECNLCDPESGCYDECECHPEQCDPCAMYGWASCECDPFFCDPWGDDDEEPCDLYPWDCECADYANSNPCECEGWGCDPDPDPGGGDPDPQPQPTEPEYIDSLQNFPCMQAILAIIEGMGANTSVGYQMNRMENLAGFDVSILFRTDPTMPATEDGYATTQGMTMSNASHTVSINPILAGATPGYIAATMMHEMIHTYIQTMAAYEMLHNVDTNEPAVDRYKQLKAGGMSGEDAAHEVMAEYFVGEITNALTSQFNIPLNEAIGMSWGGLEGTATYIALPAADKTAYNNINYSNKHANNPCQ